MISPGTDEAVYLPMGPVTPSGGILGEHFLPPAAMFPGNIAADWLDRSGSVGHRLCVRVRQQDATGNRMYAFTHIEKTAGSTLTAILRRSFGTRHCDIRLPLAKRKTGERDLRPCIDEIDLQRARRLYRDLSCIAGHNVKPYDGLGKLGADVRFFTFVRDPAARYVSQYLNRACVYTREAFDSWVSLPWTHNWQTKKIAGVPEADRAIEIIRQRVGFIGLTERFDESLVLLGQWLAEPGYKGEYRRVNQLKEKRRPRDVARERTDTSYLNTDYARQRIAEANAEDQKLYEYVVTQLYPRQVHAYPGDLAGDVRQLQLRNRTVGRLHEPLWPVIYRNLLYKPLLRSGRL